MCKEAVNYVIWNDLKLKFLTPKGGMESHEIQSIFYLKTNSLFSS